MNKKICCALAAMVSVSHAGLYMGGDAGFQNNKNSTRTHNVSVSPNASSQKVALGKDENAFVGGVFLGYEIAMAPTVSFAVEGSVDLSGFKSVTNQALTSADADAVHLTAFNTTSSVSNMRTTLKSNIGFGVMPMVMKHVSNKTSLGFGLKVNYTQFSTHLMNINHPANWNAPHKRFVFGAEPTLMIRTKLSDQLSIRGSVGYGFYQTFTTTDRENQAGTNLELQHKPRIANAKVALIWGF